MIPFSSSLIINQIMFFPNEIITEILNYLDYLTWINKVKKINQQYHSYYLFMNGRILCKKYKCYVVNWRHLDLTDLTQTIHFTPKMAAYGYIYPICVNSEQHCYRTDMNSHIELPHNY